MFYFVKTPWWLKKLYPEYTWQMPAGDKMIHLSFDDGPHPHATPFILQELKKYDASATFFCIGKNVVEYPAIYKQIIGQGHGVGNHSFNHLNGWKTEDNMYMTDIRQARNHIDSLLFRPPYGKATRFQMRLLTELHHFTPVMWSVLSGDFDAKLSKEKCLANVLNNTTDGSIVVFHDSEKAFEKIQYVLPRVLEYFTEKGFKFRRIYK